MEAIGNPRATPEQIERATKILDEVGSLAYTQQLAERMVRSALSALMEVPPSPHRDILQQWAEYLVDRSV